MKASLHETRQTGRGSIAVSIAAHLVFIALIASITFRYPLSAFFRGFTPAAERVQYVQMRPAAAQGTGNGIAAKTKAKAHPKPTEPLVAPVATPTTLPPVVPSSGGADSGTGVGTGASGNGAGIGLIGVNPSLPDPRIELRPDTRRLPLTMAQKNDSAVQAIFLDFRAAEIADAENRGRDPRDWTFQHNGQKYGLDSQYIYLGKFKLPSAILAAIPFNTGGVDGQRLRDNREADFIQNDIYTHAQGMSEDDFRDAIKRIRERKEKEHEEEEAAKKAEQKSQPATVP